MREDDGMMPFRQWLAEIDKPTAEYLSRPEAHSPAEEEAFRRGQFVGQWMTLHDLYGCLQRGATDGEKLAGMLAAGLMALKERRSPRDFRLALERHRDASDEGEPDGPEADSR